MYLTPFQTIVMILAVAAGTQLTRWLPFWLFPENREPLLVVYCLKNVTWRAAPHGIPELLAILAVVLLHRWRGNVLISIAGGTALYMAMVQFVFA